MISPLCHHEIGDMDEPSSLVPIIKRPKQFMTDQEKHDADFAPDCRCVVCGKEFKVDFSTMKGVVCIRK